MVDYEAIQVTRRISRLIQNEPKAQFPLIGAMILVLIIAMIFGALHYMVTGHA